MRAFSLFDTLQSLANNYFYSAYVTNYFAVLRETTRHFKFLSGCIWRQMSTCTYCFGMHFTVFYESVIVLTITLNRATDQTKATLSILDTITTDGHTLNSPLIVGTHTMKSNNSSRGKVLMKSDVMHAKMHSNGTMCDCFHSNVFFFASNGNETMST